jgi:hypothetical protein
VRGPGVGEISKAIYDGYHIAVHERFFPFDALNDEGMSETVHAQVDHGAKAIFCSQQWFDSLPKAEP